MLLSPSRSKASRALRIAHKRIYLRPPHKKDWKDWVQVREESRDFLVPWEPTWPYDALTRRSFNRRVRTYEQETKTGRSYSFLLFRIEDDALIGGVSLSNIRRGVAQSATLGYWIGAPFARQGYMSEALTALLEFGFEQLGVHRIEAACLPGNEASRKLLLKIGFSEEGYARHYLRINGAWQDHVLFAILREDLR